MSKELLLIAILTWHSTASAYAGEVLSCQDNPKQKRVGFTTLNEVICTLPKWNSALSSQSFHFEFCTDIINSALSRTDRAFKRVICDHDLESDNVLFFTGDNPEFLFTTDATYIYKNGEWSRTDPTWVCQLKHQLPSELIGDDRSLFPEGPIVVDIPQYLSEGLGYGTPQVHRDQVTNSYVIVKDNRSWIEIRLRSPTDAEALGCDLSEILIVPNRVGRDMPHGRMSIRSLVTKDDQGVRLNLKKKYMDSAVQSGPILNETTRALKANPLTAWLASYPQTVTNAKLGMPLVHAFNGLAGPLGSLGAPKEALNTRWNELQPVLETIATEIRNVQHQSLAVFTVGKILGIDDPVIRWRHNEMIAWETMHGLSTAYLALLLVNAKEGNHDLIYSHFDAVADFGTPVNSMEFILSRKSLSQYMPGQELFIETIFRSRHMYHVEPDEIDATVAALVYSQPGSEMERVAVETLLRLDEYDRVPPERFQRWWDAEIIQADKVFRWDTLCMLTFHPGNRAMLLEQFPNAEVKLRHKIWKNLKLRAESTVRTKRWDFMTEAECQTVLALPEPPVLGKDTEGGAAKPFPKD